MQKASKYTETELKSQDSTLEREGWCMALKDSSKRKSNSVTMEEWKWLKLKTGNNEKQIHLGQNNTIFSFLLNINVRN